jgi:hypothetical protein
MVAFTRIHCKEPIIKPVTTNTPGAPIGERPTSVRTIAGVATSKTAFIGWAPQGPTSQAQQILSWSEYNAQFGGFDSGSPLSYAVSHFFMNGGQQAYIIRLVSSENSGTPLIPNTTGFETALGEPGTPSTGALGLLDEVDLFNLLCIPGETNAPTLSVMEKYCGTRRAFLIADSDPTITDYNRLVSSGPGFSGANAAFYFPSLSAPDPISQNALKIFPPCGFVAGLYAAIDAAHGVWMAPAGIGTALAGVSGTTVPLDDQQTGVLNAVAVNCIRTFPVHGTVLWGARTVDGNDDLGSQWKYVATRRLALFLEESLVRGLKWVVFEPNGEPLWAQIRMNVGAFLETMYCQGAFQGTAPDQAYFVKCDSETTTSIDQANGIVNIIVGFASLKPAEFVIIQIQQIAGQG